MIEWALLLSLATWRVTSLLYVEAPFAWLRKMLGIVEDEATEMTSYPCNWIGDLWECFWCLSLVVAFCFAIAVYALTELNMFQAIIVWLASAGGAVVLDVRYFARLRR